MQEITNMIELILIDTLNRERLIKDFQKRIWNNLSTDSEEKSEIYRELAQTLDYYEPNEELRREDPSLYVDNKLVKEVELALVKLKNSANN